MKTESFTEQSLSNEILSAISRRRAVRKYLDKPVDHALIEKILDAGRMAPSAINMQPWRFYILTNKETIKSFSKEIGRIAIRDFIKAGPKQILKTVTNLLHFKIGADFFKNTDPVFHGAPVVIFIAAPKNNEWAALDIGMCSQNIMLAAKSLGLESCPVGFGKYAEHTKLYPLLHIPSSEQLQLAIIIGYGNESPEIHKRNRDNAVFIE